MSLMIPSWCTGRDTCNPCKPPPPATNYWYGLIYEIFHWAFPDPTTLAVITVQRDGSTDGAPVDPTSYGRYAITWSAIERNTAYDSSPGYAGYAIGNFISYEYAYDAVMQTLANSRPV